MSKKKNKEEFNGGEEFFETTNHSEDLQQLDEKLPIEKEEKPKQTRKPKVKKRILKSPDKLPQFKKQM
jgi:hypothetical protein